MAEGSIPQEWEEGSIEGRVAWEERLYAEGCEYARREAEGYFARVEEELYERRPSGWQVVGYRERRLMTRFGEVKLRRRLYRDEGGGSHFLLDEYLGVPARQAATPSVVRAMVKLTGDVGFAKAAQHLAGLTAGVLSATTVWRLTQRVGGAAVAQEVEEGEAVFRQGQRAYQEGTRVVERLFVEADGVYVRLQREQGSHMEIKSGIAYEGWQRLRGKLERYRLRGKRIYVHAAPNLAFWEGAGLAWSHHWDWSRVKQVVIGGDGAAWIERGCDWVAPSVWQLDGFHLARAAGRALGQDKGQTLYDAMRTGNFPGAHTLWQQAPKRRKKSAQRSIRWLEKLLAEQQGQDWRNQLGLDPSSQQRGLGTMEGNGAHLIADRMKGKGRSWSRRGACHMAKVRQLILNDDLDAWCWRTTQHPSLRSNTSQRPPPRRRQRDTSSWLRAAVPALCGPHNQKPWVKNLRNRIHPHLPM